MKKYPFFIIGAVVASMAFLSFRRIPLNRNTGGYTAQVKWIKSDEAQLPSGNNSKVDWTIHNQKLYAFKIRLLQGGINLLRCDIVWEDGRVTTLMLRNDIAAGEESREIINPTPQTAISRITFWYDSTKPSTHLEWWAKISG